jgi:hypothetical protein
LLCCGLHPIPHLSFLSLFRETCWFLSHHSHDCW